MTNKSRYLSWLAKPYVLPLWLLWCFVPTLLGQEYKTSDTIAFQEVVVSGEKINKYQAGSRYEKVSEEQFELYSEGNLEQLLSRSTPIFLKSNAGSLSTIRIRGTSPNHTVVFFDGININSLTLGQSNFSNIPMYLFDEVGVQYGSSSSIRGSGNIGGSIFLGIKNTWTEGFKAEAKIAHGSFGEQLYGTKLYAGNGKFESVTRLYFYNKVNDFTFTNTKVRDFENDIYEIEDVQHNANIENKGLLQEFNYKFGPNEFVTFKVWLEDDWHMVQQDMQTNYDQPNYKEYYKDENQRISGSYKNNKNDIKYAITGAFAHDKAISNDDNENTIETSRYVTDIFAEHGVNKNISYKLGLNAKHISPDVYAYPDSIDSENWLDMYASFFLKIGNRLKITTNLRQGYVTNFDVPFTPSAGINYILISKARWKFNIKGNIAKSYRVPTFNDRYWLPGGNSELDPEEGASYEMGFYYRYENNKTSAKIQANLFYMDVDNWVLWRNGGSYWTAENVQNVVSNGIEFSASLKAEIHKVKIESGINYALTNAQRKESKNSTNALNRQIEYVPLHGVSSYSMWTFKNFTFNVDGKYTCEQYTDEEDDNLLSPTILLNTSLSYRFNFNENHKLRLSGMVNNLLNVDYQSYYDYAMPGINYRVSLTYNFR